MPVKEEWRPGSFTKNFSWGSPENGLLKLHELIRLGFDNKIGDVTRHTFRRRVENAGRPDYIALNFFLFNSVRNGTDYIIADELVFQAIAFDHSIRFDKLALFAFNFSYVGQWKGASPGQRYPALWARRYTIDQVALLNKWKTSRVSADDIESFVSRDPRYIGKTTRKLATNLSYLYSIGHLSEFAEPVVSRWWVDALFLALDRIIEDRKLDRISTSESQYASLLDQSEFPPLSGMRSIEKDLATRHLIDLYVACGGRDRFSEERVEEIQSLSLPDVAWLIANDPRPQGAIHPTNPKILKSIPRACAMLARYLAGFEIIDADELANFDAAKFVRDHTRDALKRLKDRNIGPIMTSEELMKITRDR